MVTLKAFKLFKHMGKRTRLGNHISVQQTMIFTFFMVDKKAKKNTCSACEIDFLTLFSANNYGNHEN